ncbi:MAG: winged helix-turn-helix domain-containing protein [Clostridia bacterium]|nr:winged helix-turn-helix domain-containing protein [Clostridia bacterium]
MMDEIFLSFLSPDGQTHTLRLTASAAEIDGSVIPLPPQEGALLWTLAQQPGRPVPREVLLQCLWGASSSFITRIVDVYIHRLRKRLPILPLETVFKIGYVLAAMPADGASSI